MDNVTALRWLADRRAFVVAGAMKSGTCSLRYQLAALAWQDKLCLPKAELHFFDEEEEFGKGPAYYATWFDWGQGWEPPKYIGDVTPSYLYLPQVFPRLKQILPHASIVVLLRNPIDRAVSHHNHDLAKGRLVGSFQERFHREVHHGIFSPTRRDAYARGLYFDQISRLLQHFPKSQVLVVISERFRRNPRSELRRIRRFLEFPEPDLCNNLADKEFVERHVRGVYQECLRDVDFKQTLREYYAEDVRRLRVFLQDDISEWDDDFGPAGTDAGCGVEMNLPLSAGDAGICDAGF